MSHTTAIAYYIHAIIFTFKMFIKFNFHIIEFDLNSIKKRIIISCTRSYLIKRIYHLNNTIKDTFRKNKAQIARCSRQCRSYKTLFHSLDITSSSSYKISETLYNYTAAEHIGKSGYAFTVSVTVLERF